MNNKSMTSETIPAVILACGVMSASAESLSGCVIDDLTITAKVKAALMSEKDVSSTKVHVKTYKGEVQLNGHVDTADQSTTAEVATSKVAGCTSVQSNLKVGPVKQSMGRATDDTANTTKVEAALAGSPVVKAPQISATTKSGVVTLSGFADNAEPKSEAERLTQSVSHVNSVENNIALRKWLI